MCLSKIYVSTVSQNVTISKNMDTGNVVKWYHSMGT